MAGNGSYKALAMDLDGTLLNSRHQIGEEERRTLEAAREKGVRIIAVTGRSLEETIAFSGCLNREGDISILQGGSELMRFGKDRLQVDFRLISRRDRELLLSVPPEYGFYPIVYAAGKVYSRGETNPYHKMYEEMMSHEVIYTDRLEEITRNAPVGKISMLYEADKLDLAEQELMSRGLEAPWGRSHIYGTDVCSRSKSQALNEVLEMLGIAPEELIAVGDSDNDLEMLKMAGLGVAMGNGTIQLQAAADYITLDHDHHGVAQVIETFILRENQSICKSAENAK